ncbi:MAG: helix-hairpin-helix domain-containing protein, partial [Pedobacter sp.]
MRFNLLILCLFLFTSPVLAQVEVITQELLETIADDLPEDFDFIEFTGKLEDLRKHPINLNKATILELKAFMLLSPLQISNLMAHIEINGKLADLTELQAINSFDLVTYTRILPFVTLTENQLNSTTFKSGIKLAEHELMIRYSQTIEKQKGYNQLGGNSYLGSPGRAALRYAFRIPGTGAIALTIDKDAGETYFGANKRSLDFISGNINISRTGKQGKIVIGDYGLQFGQGLSLWSGFSFGKGADVTSVAKKDIGLRPYSSTNEYSYLKG